MGNTILFFGCILLVVILGTKLKINIGLVALIFTFLLGTTAGGLSAGQVVNLFPISLFFHFLKSILAAMPEEKTGEAADYACRSMFHGVVCDGIGRRIFRNKWINSVAFLEGDNG